MPLEEDHISSLAACFTAADAASRHTYSTGRQAQAQAGKRKHIIPNSHMHAQTAAAAAAAVAAAVAAAIAAAERACCACEQRGNGGNPDSHKSPRAPQRTVTARAQAQLPQHTPPHLGHTPWRRLLVPQHTMLERPLLRAAPTPAPTAHTPNPAPWRHSTAAFLGPPQARPSSPPVAEAPAPLGPPHHPQRC